MVKDLEKAKKGIRDLKRDLSRAYYQEVRRRLKSDQVHQFFTVKVMQMFQGMQEEYWGGEAEDDPTRFLNFSEIIQEEVKSQLTKSASSVTDSGEVTITVLSNEFLGIGENVGPGDSSPIKWAAYFIQGSPESSLIYTKNLIWYNKELAKKSKNESISNLGRFGAGYLIRTDSKYGKALVSKYGDAVIHPQSGKPPKDWFEIYNVINPDDIYSLIQLPARDAALERVSFKNSK